MYLFSEFSLTDALPTPLPFFPYLLSFLRHYRSVVLVGGSSFPFAPVPACHRPDLLAMRGENEVSLDSTEEAENFVGWGCKVILIDIQ